MEYFGFIFIILFWRNNYIQEDYQLVVFKGFTKALSVLSMSLSWKILKHSFLHTRTNWVTLKNLLKRTAEEDINKKNFWNVSVEKVIGQTCLV